LHQLPRRGQAADAAADHQVSHGCYLITADPRPDRDPATGTPRQTLRSHHQHRHPPAHLRSTKGLTMLSTTRRAALATAARLLALLAGCSSASNDPADVPAGAEPAEVPGTAGSGARGMADRDSAAGDEAAEGEAAADGEIAESDGAAVEPVVQNLPE